VVFQLLRLHGVEEDGVHDHELRVHKGLKAEDRRPLKVSNTTCAWSDVGKAKIIISV